MKKKLMATAMVLVLTHCASFPPDGNHRPVWNEALCAEKEKALAGLDVHPDQAHLDLVMELNAQDIESCRSGK